MAVTGPISAEHFAPQNIKEQDDIYAWRAFVVRLSLKDHEERPAIAKGYGGQRVTSNLPPATKQK